MRSARISATKTMIETTEDIDRDTAVLWLVPYIGYFPTYRAAEKAAVAHDNGYQIRPVSFYRSCMGLCSCKEEEK